MFLRGSLLSISPSYASGSVPPRLTDCPPPPRQPGRTYYLEDTQGYALEWVKAIEEVRVHTYGSD